MVLRGRGGRGGRHTVGIQSREDSETHSGLTMSVGHSTNEHNGGKMSISLSPCLFLSLNGSQHLDRKPSLSYVYVWDRVSGQKPSNKMIICFVLFTKNRSFEFLLYVCYRLGTVHVYTRIIYTTCRVNETKPIYSHSLPVFMTLLYMSIILRYFRYLILKFIYLPSVTTPSICHIR